LQRWIAEGKLRFKPSTMNDEDPVIRTTDVMRVLVNDLYM